MSRVTNVLLSIDTLHSSAAEKLKEINEFFEAEEIRGFVPLDSESLPQRWYGGTKFLEAFLCAGAFNHLDLPSLISHIQSIAWPGPTSVQLIVKGQEENRFSVVDVVEPRCND